MQIIPTILTTDIKKAEEKLEKFKGIFQWVQLDVMDGVFVDNKTLLPNQFANLDILSSFKVDAHLMVDNPISFLSDCQKIKAVRVIAQIEMMADQAEFVQKTIQLGIKPGLAVDLHTAINKLDENLLSKLDVILLMAVKAGWGGQKFQAQVLEKAKKLVKIKEKEKLNFKIALDGGIRPENIKSAYQTGTEIFFVGSFLGKEPRKALEELKRAVL